jgi:hypothetical protein
MTTEALRDIHGPVAVPFDGWWLLPAVLAAGVLAAAVYLFLRPGRVKAVPLAVVLPWEKAWSALESMERFDPRSPGEIKMFYFQLSGIVRTYIEERFNIRAPEMTTEEFMERARSSVELSSAEREFLNDFLNVSDMVKFARHEPEAGDRLGAVHSAKSFVRRTSTEASSPLKEGAHVL